MKHTWVLAVVLGVFAVAAVTAQDKPPAMEAQPVRAAVLGVEEVAVEAGKPISVPETWVLNVIPNRQAGTFYLAVKVNVEIPPNVVADLRGLKIELTFGTAQPLPPYAFATDRKSLDDGKTTCRLSDKRQWVTAQYYFPTDKGQRGWEISVNGKPVGKVLDYFVTVVLSNVDDITSRIKLPDDSMQTITGWHQASISLPVGSYDLVLEVRGYGKVKLPWPKYDKGEVKYLAVAKDQRNVPGIPGDRLRKALPKIEAAWKMFHTKKGVGGGAYNIATEGNPVHVNIDFGRDGAVGELWRCEVDQIQVEYAPEAAPSKTGAKSKGPRLVKYGDMHSSAWKVQPWEKAEFVSISRDAREVVGEVVSGRLIVRSVEGKPSTWDSAGLLSHGAVFDKDLGYFDVHVKKEGELTVLYGVSVKGP